MLPKLADIGSFFPKIVSSGPCKDVIRREGFSLQRISRPALLARRRRPLHHAAAWSSRKNPDTGKRNCGMYRMQVFDDRTTGMHWQTHKQGAEHYRRLRAAGTVSAWTSPSPSAPTRHHVLRHPPAAARSRRNDDRRLPPRQACRNGQVRNRAISKFPPTPRSSSKATSNSANSATKVPSATTPASTPSTTTTRSSTSPA